MDTYFVIIIATVFIPSCLDRLCVFGSLIYTKIPKKIYFCCSWFNEQSYSREYPSEYHREYNSIDLVHKKSNGLFTLACNHSL